jgi:hypothetical protein
MACLLSDFQHGSEYPACHYSSESAAEWPFSWAILNISHRFNLNRKLNKPARAWIADITREGALDQHT